MNLERICRTCTCECLEMFTLFSECDSVPLECTKKLSDMVTACTSVQISINDGLPELICARCINELTIAYTFKRRCEKADVVIRQQIKQNIENINNGNEIVLNSEPVQEKNDSHTKSDVDFIEGKKRSTPNEIQSASNYVKQTCDNNLALHNIKSCINNGDDDFKDAIKITKVETIDEYILEEAKIEFQEYDIDTFASDVVYSENGLKCETESFSDTEDKPLSKRKLLKHSGKVCDKTERYTCVKCGASFSIQSNWHRHVKTHDNKTYVCEICNKAFARSDGLAVHIQRHANNGKQHICVTCGKKYSSKSSLSVHMLLHSKNNLNSLKEKAHQCHYCQKGFISNSSLVIHIRTHTKEKPFLCQTCGKGFATRGGVDLHQRRHTGERPYKCEFCGKGFAESSNLKVHIRAHTGDKPHLCSLCGKRFTRNFLLQLHIRTHTGEKPYACPECPKAFAQQGDLAAHKRTHTGQRPHVCQHCGQGFIKSSGLKKHIQSKHPKDHVESSTEELILPV